MSTTRDRQELWHLESFLMVNGTTKAHHDRRLSLYRYLCETCEHEWGDVSGWGGCPKGTVQCGRCNAVCTPGEKRPSVGRMPSINEGSPRPTPAFCADCGPVLPEYAAAHDEHHDSPAPTPAHPNQAVDVAANEEARDG